MSIAIMTTKKIDAALLHKECKTAVFDVSSIQVHPDRVIIRTANWRSFTTTERRALKDVLIAHDGDAEVARQEAQKTQERIARQQDPSLLTQMQRIKRIERILRIA